MTAGTGMRRPLSIALASALGVALAAPAARAEEPASGYCDWVEGVAASESALLFSPAVFASLGFLDQGPIAIAPEATGDDMRITAGVSYRITGVFEGIAVRRRARAECRRHRALARVGDETVRRALEARYAVLEKALGRSDRLLDRVERDLAQRRVTAQDATALRLRVDELRALAARTRADIAALGAPGGGGSGGSGGEAGGALLAYHQADREIARQEARLRRARAFDVSVRAGYDAFTGPIDDDESPLFAVVQVGVNLGALLQGGAEERAASGRRRFVEQERGGAGEPSLRALRVLAAEQRRRAEQTGVLVADLEKQLADLERVGGETGRRFRDTVWFELVKVRAEHAYLQAHAAGLAALVGETSP